MSSSNNGAFNFMKIGIIGCGYWGPNLIRNFYQIPEVESVYACDSQPERLEYVKNLYPNVHVTQHTEDIFNNSSIDAVCIATPVTTHYPLALSALKSDKNVYIEKPLTDNSTKAQELICLAEKKKKVIFVGHTFEFSPAVLKLRKIIQSGTIGKLFYINCARLNLGLLQNDINVVWDLAPHDLSIINLLLQTNPISVTAVGSYNYKSGIEDVAFLTLNYPDNIIAHLHVSWLDPCKTRKITLVADKKMVVYDDIDIDEPIKIYDKGIEKQPYYDSFGEFKLLYRFGDIVSPRIEPAEPLKNLCKKFIECITNGSTANAQSGLDIVKILEAAQRSIKNNGQLVHVNY